MAEPVCGTGKNNMNTMLHKWPTRILSAHIS